MIRFLRDYMHALQQAWLVGWQQPSLDTELGKREASYEVTEASPTAGGDDGPAPPRPPSTTGGAGHRGPLFSCPVCGQELLCASAIEMTQQHLWETEL